MGSIFGSKSGSSTQTSKSEPWGPAQEALKKILADAGKIYDAQGGINAEWVDKELADLTPEMQQTVKDLMGSQGFKDLASNIQENTQKGLEGIGSASGALEDYASGSKAITADDINNMAKDLYQSELVESQTQKLTKDVQEGLASNIQGLNQQAVASGGMGSSRAGVAEGVATGKAAEAIATGSSNIQNAAREAALGQAMNTLSGNQATQIGAAQGLGNLGIQSGNLQSQTGNWLQQALENQKTAAGLTQSQAQAEKDYDYFNKTGAQNAGWNNLFNYLNATGSIGGMGGQGTTTGGGNASSGFSNILGLGSTAAGIYGMGSQAGWFSDATMKKNIKRKKKGGKGQEAEYSWEWNKSAQKSQGLKGKASGVLAQETAKTSPEAVSKGPNGALMVDYDKTSAEPTGKQKKAR